MTGCKLIGSPTEQHFRLHNSDGGLLDDPTTYYYKKWRLYRRNISVDETILHSRRFYRRTVSIGQNSIAKTLYKRLIIYSSRYVHQIPHLQRRNSLKAVQSCRYRDYSNGMQPSMYTLLNFFQTLLFLEKNSYISIAIETFRHYRMINCYQYLAVL